MTTSFHRSEVETGYIIINQRNWEWSWHKLELPQLIRKTVSTPEEMIPTDFHHTIYEIQGDIQDLALIENSELLDKKVITKNNETSLILEKDMTMEEELVEYLTYILELDDEKISRIVGLFNDYATKIDME
jgi:hypothetical protein